MIVDCAHYKSGARQHAGPRSIADAASCASSGEGFVWLGIHDPTDEEIREIGARFPLHALAVEDARHEHQRAKIEQYEPHYFVVLRTVHYDEARGEVVFGRSTYSPAPISRSRCDTARQASYAQRASGSKPTPSCSRPARSRSYGPFSTKSSTTTSPWP